MWYTAISVAPTRATQTLRSVCRASNLKRAFSMLLAIDTVVHLTISSLTEVEYKMTLVSCWWHFPKVFNF